jgi:hypothetical protein
MTTSELITESVSNGVASWEREQNRVLTNFTGDARESFAFRMKCINAAGGGDASVGKVIPVRNWLVHEVEFTNEETGEVVKTFRTVLVSPDGEAVAFVSQGVANGVRQIFSEFGTEPLDPPLLCRVEQRSTSKKRRVYVLIVVPDADTTPAQPAAKTTRKTK